MFSSDAVQFRSFPIAAASRPIVMPQYHVQPGMAPMQWSHQPPAQPRPLEQECDLDMSAWAPEYSRSFGEQTQFSASYEDKLVPAAVQQIHPDSSFRYVSPGVSPTQLHFFHNYPSNIPYLSPQEDSAFDDPMSTDDMDCDSDTCASPRWLVGSPNSHEVPHFEMESDQVDDVEDESEITEEHELDHLNRTDDDETSINSSDNPFQNVVLPPSKTPCLDALAFCVVMSLGCELSREDDSLIFVSDCTRMLAYIKHFCPKQNQTNNNEARIKALKRWFNSIPTKRRRLDQFTIDMKPDKKQAIQRILRKMEIFAANEGLISPAQANRFV